MKRVLFVFLLLFTSSLVFASGATGESNLENKRVVTNKWSLLVGSASVTDHYMTNQEFKGSLIGIKGEHGAFFKESENLSWDLDLSFAAAPKIGPIDAFALDNPAGTAKIVIYDLNVQYGVHYNWNPAERLFIKAGGFFDLRGAMNSLIPNGINNARTIDFQPQFKAAAAIKYGWDLKNCDIDLYANFALPFMGFMLVNTKYEFALGNNSEILPGEQKHFLFTSFHNLSGFNMEVGVDFVFNGLTLSLSHEGNNRWWNAYELQNYRKYSFFKIGFGVDLVSVSRKKSNNRYF